MYNDGITNNRLACKLRKQTAVLTASKVEIGTIYNLFDLVMQVNILTTMVTLKINYLNVNQLK